MASDRIVLFDTGAVALPTVRDLQLVLEDYLGAYAQKVYWKSGCWTALLVGQNSWPLRRLAPNLPLAGAYAEEAKRSRWIEVFLGDDYVNVVTRSHDEATNALADGFAELVARYWQGKFEGRGPRSS